LVIGGKDRVFYDFGKNVINDIMVAKYGMKFISVNEWVIKGIIE